jgi:lipid II:glycine glycyltransferase (peptidoglycan interpeptide bridge formation enzyme)
MPIAEPFERVYTGQEVVVDLHAGGEALLRTYRPAVRKNRRKALSFGVTCYRSNATDCWEQFKRLYGEAMEAKQAAPFYHFGSDYFDAVRSTMSESCSLYVAEADGRPVSAELVLHAGEVAHSFLGGTAPDSLHLQANTLLKTVIAEDLRERGFHMFVLGGGVTPGDGVFAYKKSFSPRGVFDSAILLGLYDPASYGELRRELASHGGSPSSGRFQFYDQS